MVPEAEANKARVLGWKQQLKKGVGERLAPPRTRFEFSLT